MKLSHPVENSRRFEYYLFKKIFDFVNPCLVHLMFPCKRLFPNISVPLFPIEILISWNNTNKFEEFKHILLSYTFRKSLVSKVAQLGNYSTMLWFQSNGIKMNESVLIDAAERGDVNLFASILGDIQGNIQAKSDLLEEACEVAAEHGHVDILKYARSKSLLPNDEFGLMKVASLQGHLNILEWYYIDLEELQDFRFEFKLLFYWATKGGKMSVLLWLKSHLSTLLGDGYWERFVRKAMKSKYLYLNSLHIAASIGNYQIFLWLTEQGFYIDSYTASAALNGGNFEILKYIKDREENSPWVADVYITAAEKGNLGLLQNWMKETECPLPTSKMFPTVARCDKPCVTIYQWLFDQACPFLEDESFHLLADSAFIKFARLNGSPIWNNLINRVIQNRAAASGDLELIQWARLETIQWLRTEIPDSPGINITRMVRNAAECGHIHILEFLRPEFVSIESDYILKECDNILLREAAVNGHVAILDWSLAIGINLQFDDECLKMIIKNSHFKVLVWLNTHFPTCFKECGFNPLVLAAKEGTIQIYQWILKVIRDGTMSAIEVEEIFDIKVSGTWDFEELVEHLKCKRRKPREGRLDLRTNKGSLLERVLELY